MENLSNAELIQVRDLCELALGGDREALAALRATYGEIKTAADIWEISKNAFEKMNTVTKEDDHALASRRAIAPTPQKPTVSRMAKMRLSVGLTQAALAAETGMNIRHIQKIEAGEVKIENLSIINGIKIADALGVSVEKLIGKGE